MNPIDRLTPDALVAHGAFVLALARSLTRDEASAFDLRQETLVTALEAAPTDRSVRGWLAATVRSRKVDQERRDVARRRREATAAKPEARVRDSASQLEQLELNHSVVQAVLELEEPYRGVVMDVYYEGLTPKEIARRSGAKAGTVRSQLSRAHDQLRSKLDRRHGERSLWTVPFMGVVQREDAIAAAAGKGGAQIGASGPGLSLGGWPALGIGAIGLSTGCLLLQVFGPDDSVSKKAPVDVGAERAVAVADGAAAKSHAGSGLSVPDTLGGGRQPVAARAPIEVSDTLASEVPALLERVRDLRAEILQRAMFIEPAVVDRFAWLDGNGAVVRLLNRERYGMNWSLPSMKGGGGFYSFSQRSSDARRRPQISHMGERLYLEGQWHAGLCLGQMPLSSVPLTHTWTGAALSQEDAIQFDVAWADRVPEHDAGASSKFLVPEAGMSYLLRSVEEREGDFLVAFEVLAVDGEGCTIAWLQLKEWPVEAAQAGVQGSVQTNGPADGPRALGKVTDEQLREELGLTLEHAQKILFESHPTAVENTYADLRHEEGCGLARLLDFEGPWSELKGGNGHGAEISPLTGAHGEEHTYLGFNVNDGVGELTPSLSCTAGLVCDLGSVPLDRVTLRSLSDTGDEKVKLALDPWFGATPPPFSDTKDAYREADRYWRALAAALPQRLTGTGMGTHAHALAGHTYLIRSVHYRERNLLFAAHVAALDEYGVIVAWRVLDDSTACPHR